jgi:phenylalanyl-tRNA synthetase beta subunit
VAQIESRLEHLAGDDLVLLDFVRQYAGHPLPEGTKSVSYHLEVGSTGHTLSAEEVTAIRNRIIDGMRSQGYELRV